MKGRMEHESKAEEKREDKKEEAKEKRDHKARGGRMEKKDHEKMMPRRKAGGAVHGKAPMHRLDKKARGGRMTPGSPFSGADTKPLGFEHDQIPSVDEGGKGKDKG